MARHLFPVFLNFLLVLVMVAQTASAQILPARKSQTDRANNRQGHWVIWFDERWKETKNPDSAVFYRKITYRDNQPVDLVQDFYRNGKIQWKGRLVSEGPPAVYEGPVSWYYETGQERIRAVFSNGALTGGFKAWRKDGTLVEGSWDAPVKEAENEEDRSRRLALYLRARDNAEAIFTSHSVEYATQSENAAYELLGSGRFDEAAAGFGDAVRLYSRLLPHEDERITDAMDMLAYCFNRIGNQNAEREVLQQLVGLIEKFHGGYSKVAASAWASLGDLSQTEPQQAELFYTKGFELLKTRTQSADEFNQQRYVVYALHNFLIEHNEWNKAKQINKESMELTRRWAGPESEMIIELLSWQSDIETGLGDPSAAHTAATSQYALATRILPPDDNRIAGALVKLADWDLQSGQFAQAEEKLLQAKAIYEMHPPVTEPAYGTLLSKLIDFYHSLNREEKESIFSSAYFQFLVNTNGAESVGVAQYHLGRVGHALELRNFKEAEDPIVRSEQILNAIRRARAPNKTDTDQLEGEIALSKSILALARYEDARIDAQQNSDVALRDQLMKSAKFILVEAEQQMNKAVTLIQGNQPRIVMLLQQMMAMSKIMSGDLTSAEKYLLAASAGISGYFGETSPEYCEVLTLRGFIRKGLGDIHGAYELFGESFRNYRAYCIRVVPYLSETERQIFYNKLNASLQQYSLMAAENSQSLDPAVAGDLYNALLLSKSAGLDHLRNIRSQLTGKNDSEGIRLLNEWKMLKEQLIAVYRASPTDENKQIQSRLEDQVNTMERQLAGRSQSFSDFNQMRNVDWRQVSAGLHQDEAAVEMIRAEDSANPKAYYVALILKPGGRPPEMVVLNEAKKLETRNLRFYHNAIRNHLTDSLSYAALWKPVGQAIGSAKRIYFSPDGLYNQVNLQTLRNPSSGKYLSDETDITMLTTTRQILKPAGEGALREVMMFGNPDFGTRPDTSANLNTETEDRGASFFQVPDLPGTRAEIEGLELIFKKGQIKYKTFSRTDANEENIRKVAGAQVLHIATHGFFMQDMEKKPANELLEGFMGSKAAENPMLRSGLMLAGCRSATDRKRMSVNDGVLTAFEAANLDLNQTRMVVMSACETGLGTVINGEGVIGLPRAFLSAGSQSVLMSLWKVDDQATQELMRNFYGRWAKSGDAEASWKQAQTELRVKYPSPYYWGAFVLLR